MPLNEIRPGIYSLDGYNPGNDIEPVFALHPFYKALGYFRQTGDFRALVEKRMPLQAEYVKRLENIVKNHGGPIIILEECSNMKKTAGHFERLGRSKDAYFIETKADLPELKEISWGCLIDFLREFKGNPVKLAGGCFIESAKYGHVGCLAVAAEKLGKKMPIEIIKEATFSYLPNRNIVMF